MPGVLSLLSTCAAVPVTVNRGFDNRLKNINFDHYETCRRDLVPDTDSYQEIFAQPHLLTKTILYSVILNRDCNLRWRVAAYASILLFYAGEGPGRV